MSTPCAKYLQAQCQNPECRFEHTGTPLTFACGFFRINKCKNNEESCVRHHVNVNCDETVTAAEALAPIIAKLAETKCRACNLPVYVNQGKVRNVLMLRGCECNHSDGANLLCYTCAGTLLACQTPEHQVKCTQCDQYITDNFPVWHMPSTSEARNSFVKYLVENKSSDKPCKYIPNCWNFPTPEGCPFSHTHPPKTGGPSAAPAVVVKHSTPSVASGFTNHSDWYPRIKHSSDK